MLRILCLLTFLLSAGWCSAQFQDRAQHDSQAQAMELDSLGANFNLTNRSRFQGLNILDNQLEHYRFFLVGEKHRQPGNFRMQMKLTRYFNEKAGARVLLFEYGPSMAWAVNRYLESGDVFDLLFIEDFTFAQEDYFKFLKQLYLYNKLLPESKRLIVEGIDLENQSALALRVMRTICEDDPPERLKGWVAALDSALEATTVNRHFFDLSRRQAANLFGIDSSAFATWAGEEWETVYPMIRGMVHSDTYYELRTNKVANAHKWREKRIFSRTQEIVAAHPDEKFFGQLGQLHTTLGRPRNWLGMSWWTSMAQQLNEKAIATQAPGIFTALIIYKYGKLEHDRTLLGSSNVDRWLDHSPELTSIYLVPGGGKPIHPHGLSSSSESPRVRAVIVNRIRPNK